MKKILTLLCCAMAISAFAQPVIEWQRVFGGSNRDLGAEIQPTEDGGYIVAGITYSSNSGDVGPTQGDGDYWVVKIDAVGAIEWQRTLGGSDTDWARAVQQTKDGGYILGGQTESDDGDVSGNNGNEDIWIVKLSPTGALEWQQVLGGTGNDFLESVRQTTDGGYFVCGTAGSSNGDVSGNHGLTDVWAIKLNATGAIQWKKALGGSNFDGGLDGIQTTDGGFVLAGSASSIDGDLSFSLGEKDVWIVKLTAEGSTEWGYIFGGDKEDVPTSIIQANDGGYIVAAFTYSSNGDVVGNHGGGDSWVLKLSATGLLEWQRTLGGSNSDVPYSIRQTSDGGYIVAVTTYSTDGQVTSHYGNQDCWLVKLDGSGNVTWEKTLGGSGEDQIAGTEQTADGGYILVAYSNSTNGDVSANLGEEDFWVVKLSSGITGTDDDPTLEPAALSIFPNPASGLVKLTLDREAAPVHAVLTDVSGKMLYAKNIDDAGYLDVSDLPSGVYSLTVTDSEGGKYRSKILKQ
ncbi:MAG: T9SS type A sorting domain-containing protein [Saprospiraceae bacterium]|nr:T9SS type A sorting domain-containing protein [Saprospiraceae bacterium]